MDAQPSPRPRAVSIVGWVWLVLAGLRFVNGLLGLIVWKVGGIDRMAFLKFSADSLRIRIAGLETFVQHAGAILAAQIVIAGAVAWIAFELLRMKPWARTALRAVAAVGIVFTLGVAAYVYAATVRMEGVQGVEAEQLRVAGMAASALITLLGAAFFGITIWMLSRPAVRRAFEASA